MRHAVMRTKAFAGVCYAGAVLPSMARLLCEETAVPLRVMRSSAETNGGLRQILNAPLNELQHVPPAAIARCCCYA